MIRTLLTKTSDHIARMLVLLALLLGIPLAAAAAQSSPQLQSGQCAEKLADDYLCGPSNSEELLHLEGTPWIFASQYIAPFLKKGVITLINQTTREWAELDVSGSAGSIDRKRFPGCQKPLTAAGFRGHGMTFGPVQGGKALLYAINHGEREAVEVFEVSARGDAMPGFRWVGCIPSPDGDSLNTLTVLPDGTLVGTKFYEVQNKDWPADMMSKRITGQVFQWQLATGWNRVPKTFMSGPNGVVSADGGQSLIVAEWGASRLHKLRRDGTGKAQTVEVQGYPDNIHPTPDGRFLVVAQTGDLRPAFACVGTDSRICGGAYDIVSIDPATMATQIVYSAKDPDPKVFGFATSALDLGKEIWVGSVRGNKILILKK